MSKQLELFEKREFMKQNKYKNLEGYTGAVSIEDLMSMRKSIEEAVDKIQSDTNAKPNYGSSIEGEGFNIRFKFKEKDYFLRCELDEVNPDDIPEPSEAKIDDVEEAEPHMNRIEDYELERRRRGQ